MFVEPIQLVELPALALCPSSGKTTIQSNPLAAREGERRFTAIEFQHLAAVPAAVEWFANIDNPRTCRAYRNDLTDFSSFIDLASADDFRQVTRSNVLALRADLEGRGLAGATIRRKLAALISLFDHLLDSNAVAGGNPVHGIKRPRIETNEGKTAALGDQQAKVLLDVPDETSVKGLRDRAILAGLLYHEMRREEAAQLQVNHLVERRRIRHLMVHGKGGKVRYLPVHPVAADRIHAYLERSGHQLADPKAPLFVALRHWAKGLGVKANGICTLVEVYAKKAGIQMDRLSVHGLRATAATNALEHEADIAKVQPWLGRASISTTKIYDRRQNRPEYSPTYKVRC